MKEFGLTNLEVRVAKAVCDTTGFESISGLGEKLSLSKHVISRAVKSLQRKGLLQVTRVGKRKEVRLASTQPAIAFREAANANPHVDLEDILAYSSLQVLSGMAYPPVSVSDIARITATPEITVRRVLSKLLERGIVARQKRGAYMVVLPRLNEFVESYVIYALEAKRSGIAGSLICRGPNGLLRSATAKTPPFMVLTGLSIFHKYGVPVLQTDSRDYYLGLSDKKRSPSLEEAVVHALVRAILIASTREVSYAMLVLQKNLIRLNEKSFLQAAKDFGILIQATTCLNMVKAPAHKSTPSEVGIYPSREEFEELVRQYA